MADTAIIATAGFKACVNHMILGLLEQSQCAADHPHARVFVTTELCGLAVAPISQHIDGAMVVLGSTAQQ